MGYVEKTKKMVLVVHLEFSEMSDPILYKKSSDFEYAHYTDGYGGGSVEIYHASGEAEFETLEVFRERVMKCYRGLFTATFPALEINKVLSGKHEFSEIFSDFEGKYLKKEDDVWNHIQRIWMDETSQVATK